jgi:[acyl-carrier-protein] S-malonyltransferase
MPTSLAQPAIFVAGIISWDSHKASSVDMLAGHSLGEYAALVAGEAISFAHALRVVQVRGDAMQRSSKKFGGGMAAVIGLPLEEVETIADSAGVTVANDNAPLQVVVSGTDEGIAAIAVMSKDRGARCVRVEVGGSFHTRAMDDTKAPLRDALDHIHIRMPKVPIISNVSARPYRAPGEIRKLLVEQVSGRVRFRESLAWAASKGVLTFVD